MRAHALPLNSPGKKRWEMGYQNQPHLSKLAQDSLMKFVPPQSVKLYYTYKSMYKCVKLFPKWLLPCTRSQHHVHGKSHQTLFRVQLTHTLFNWDPQWYSHIWQDPIILCSGWPLFSITHNFKTVIKLQAWSKVWWFFNNFFKLTEIFVLCPLSVWTWGSCRSHTGDCFTHQFGAPAFQVRT